MKRFQQPGALRVRDDGLRRVRKITWRAGLLAAVGAVLAGARFAHLSPSLPHLPSDLTGGQVTSGGYPVLASATVPPELEPLARRTVASCPRLALLIERAEPGRAGY